MDNVTRPLPMDHPIVLHAPPRARTLSGKISTYKSLCVSFYIPSRPLSFILTGYSHVTVNHVMPKNAVYKNTNTVAPIPIPYITWDQCHVIWSMFYINIPVDSSQECPVCIKHRYKQSILLDTLLHTA